MDLWFYYVTKWYRILMSHTCTADEFNLNLEAWSSLCLFGVSKTCMYIPTYICSNYTYICNQLESIAAFPHEHAQYGNAIKINYMTFVCALLQDYNKLLV